MITITGLEILDVLESLGELEWIRCGAVREQKERLSRPPFTAWRYKTRNYHLESLIVKAVESFHGNVEWEIKFTGKNWLITPKYLEQFQQEQEYKRDVDAIKALSIEFPELGMKANQDVPILANKIKETVTFKSENADQ